MSCCKNCTINITILVLSSSALFLQVLILALRDFEQSTALQVVIAVLTASLAFVQSLQLGLRNQGKHESLDSVMTKDAVKKDAPELNAEDVEVMIEKSLHKSAVTDETEV